MAKKRKRIDDLKDLVFNAENLYELDAKRIEEVKLLERDSDLVELIGLTKGMTKQEFIRACLFYCIDNKIYEGWEDLDKRKIRF